MELSLQEPVGHTCPTIAVVTAKIEDIETSLASREPLSDEEYDVVRDELEYIKASFLKVRKANHLLRTWGTKLADTLRLLHIVQHEHSEQQREKTQTSYA